DILSLHETCSMKFTFFFQAEDGIRDRTVTGVQTCALPIFIGIRPVPLQRGASGEGDGPCRTQRAAGEGEDAGGEGGAAGVGVGRSEERRVGKECRSGWGSEL